METAELGKIIQRKHVLLDSCIYIDLFEHFQEYVPLLKLMQQADTVPVDSDVIRFEILRGAHSKDYKKKRAVVLDQIGANTLAIDQTIIASALELARMYSMMSIHSPSFIDCVLGAFLAKYKSNILLLTRNHADFPTAIFDRVAILPLGATNDILTLAFYQYNADKWARLKNKLQTI